MIKHWRQHITTALILGGAWIISHWINALGNLGVIVLGLLLNTGFACALFIMTRRRRRLHWLIYLKSGSPLSHWARGGLLTFCVQWLLSLPVALLFLQTLAQQPGIYVWLALVVAFILWPGLCGVINVRLKGHFLEVARVDVAAKLSFWIVGGLLVAGLTLYLFFHLPLANFSHENIQTAFAYQMQKAPASQSSGLLFFNRYWAGLNGAVYWLTEQTSTHLLPIFSILLWLLIILQSVLFVWPLCLLMRAATLFWQLEAAARKGIRIPSYFAFAAWTAPIFVVAVLLGLAQPVLHIHRNVSLCLHPDNNTPQCYAGVPVDYYDQVVQAGVENLTLGQQAAYQRLYQQVDQQLEEAFAKAHKRVPKYVDWYYSMGTRAKKAGAAVASWVGFNGFVASIEEKKNSWPISKIGIQKLTRRLDQNVLSNYQRIEQGLFNELVETIRLKLANYQVMPQQPADFPTVNARQLMLDGVDDFLAPQKVGFQLAIAGGGAAATLTGQQFMKRAAGVGARQAAEKGAGRVATEQILKRAATSAGQQVTKRGLGAAAMAPCVASGPVAPVCSVSIFVLSATLIQMSEWEVDKLLNQQEMAAQLNAQLDTYEKQLKRAYQKRLLELFPDQTAALTQRFEHLTPYHYAKQ